jgi:hypothetical protein
LPSSSAKTSDPSIAEDPSFLKFVNWLRKTRAALRYWTARLPTVSAPNARARHHRSPRNSATIDIPGATEKSICSSDPAATAGRAKSMSVPTLSTTVQMTVRRRR